MAFTKIYSLELDFVLSRRDSGSSAALVSTAEGGYLRVDASDGQTNFYAFGANGGFYGYAFSVGGDTFDPAVAELADGHAVVASSLPGGDIRFDIRDPAASGNVASGSFSDPGTSNAAVAGLTGGGFIIATEDFQGAATTAIDWRYYNAAGVLLDTFAYTSGTSRNADVAGLADGGFVIAWEKVAGATTEVWYGVYNANATVRKAPALLDTQGSINRNVQLAAYGTGFVMVYEDNGWTSGDTDITLARFNAAGARSYWADVAQTGEDEETPDVTVLSNGFVAVSYGYNFIGPADTATIVRLIDPATEASAEAILASFTVLAGEAASDDTDEAALAAFGGSGIAVYHTNQTDDQLQGEQVSAVAAWTGDAAADVMTGDGLIDRMEGGGGGDTLTGNGGDDTLNGGAGLDSLSGGGGSDRLNGGADADTLAGGDDQDFLNGGGGSDVIDAGAGNDYINAHDGGGNDSFAGGAGKDYLSFAGLAAAVVVNLAAGTATGAASGSDTLTGIEVVTGDDGNDSMTGDALANEFSGEGGNDTLSGGEGADSIGGEDGDDIINGGGGADLLSGGAGSDTVSGGDGHDLYYLLDAAETIIEAANQGTDTVKTDQLACTLTAHVEWLYFFNAAGVTGKGNAASNKIYGGTGNDLFIMDGAGDDQFQGDKGLDTLDFRLLGGATVNFATNVNAGSAAGDVFSNFERVWGSSTGIDTISGGNREAIFSGFGGNDALNGGSKADTLNGGDGNDTLKGNAANDVLAGNLGNDTLTGGIGNDTFLFGEAGWGADSITDFQDGLDKIKVDNAIAASFADFTVTGNNTATVVLTLAAAPVSTITLHSAGGAINVSASDLIFF